MRGVNVFKEYWRNPEATAATFDGDWFKTGDIGAFDSEGFLTITGRKKEIIVTAGGKNVAPAALEDPIRANPIVGQVVVVGDQKPFISALVTLDSEMLPTWLGNNNLSTDMSLTDAAKNPAVRAEVQRAIDAANANVSRAESIRKFTILDTEWSGSQRPPHPEDEHQAQRDHGRLRRRGRRALQRARVHDDDAARLSTTAIRAARQRNAPGPLSRQNQSLSRISRIAIRRVSAGSRSRYSFPSR